MYNQLSTYEELEKELDKILEEDGTEYTQESYSTFAEIYKRTLRERQKPLNTVELPSWSGWNRITGGFSPYQFTILCGPTGAGKSTLLASITAQTLIGLIPTFVGSVEIGADDFVAKVISVFSKRDLVRGGLSDSEKERIDDAMGLYKNFHHVCFTNYSSRVPHRKFLCDLLHAHHTQGIKIALVDNLNFMMDVDDARNSVVQMDRAIHDFVVFCKKVPIHVVMVMHPRKTEGGRVESEFDIKGSSTAVQEATNVILFNRLKEPTDAPLGLKHEWCREVKFVKLRNKGRYVGSKIIMTLAQGGEELREVEAK